MSQPAIPNLTVTELKAKGSVSGKEFNIVAIVQKTTTRTARNNNPFLQVEVGDRTGSFTFLCFGDHPAFTQLENDAEGKIARISGTTDSYNDRFSPKISAVELLPDDEVQRLGLLDNLVATSPENREVMIAELKTMVGSIKNRRIQKTVQLVLDELGPTFYESTAAISMHHAYRSGLLEHTLHLARACKVLLPLYPEVDRDLALAGCLLHDTGKCLEYISGLIPKRSRLGILQGHVVLGYRLVRKAGIQAKLPETLLERLEHIVLSHQGELEWGAAAMAATPEAVFVSMIDNLDAKMGMVQHALRNRVDGSEFSDYLPGLKAPLLVLPPNDSTEPELPFEEPKDDGQQSLPFDFKGPDPTSGLA